jgi:hypothetical protein
LLSEGVAPATPLHMRHAGSEVIALRSTVGGAAGLTVDEDGGGTGTPRLTKWRPSWRAHMGEAAE